MRTWTIALFCFLIFFTHFAHGKRYAIDGSPFAAESAPLPKSIKSSNEKTIIIDPNEHAWGAYDAEGKLLRWGIATAGADWCPDIDRPCRTKPGQFRIYSLGDRSCISNKFPLPDGGAPMPYCMYFNGGQAIHGSHDVQYANISHGCVRVNVADAKWLRYQFVESPSLSNQFRGTKVVIKAYAYGESFKENLPFDNSFDDRAFDEPSSEEPSFEDGNDNFQAY